MYLKMEESELDPNAPIVWKHIHNLNMMLAQSRIYSYKSFSQFNKGKKFAGKE